MARAYTGIQEVIVQNFRAKPDTAMRHQPDLTHEEYLATLAVARIVPAPGTSLQAPPNLTDEASLAYLLRAGIDDWSGVSPVTADHVNPGALGRTSTCQRMPPGRLASGSASSSPSGRSLVLRSEPWVHPRIAAHVHALADPGTGLAATDAEVRGRPWQDPVATGSPGWGSRSRTGWCGLARPVSTRCPAQRRKSWMTRCAGC